MAAAVAAQLAVLAAVAIAQFPIFWLVSMSFKTQVEWTKVPLVWWSARPTLDNYRLLLGQRPQDAAALGSFVGQVPSALPPIINSLVVVSVATALATAIGTLAAYSISRWNTGGSMVFFGFLQMRMVPPVAVLMPLFVLWSSLRLLDSPLGLVIVYAGTTFPFVVWLMKSFFDEIPRELDEAAIVDGSSRLGALAKVVLPLARTGLAVTALFVFILNWSDFLVAFILTSREAITIPVQLGKYVSGTSGLLYGPRAALGVVAILPVVVLGLAIQKHLVRGLTFGAIKR